MNNKENSDTKTRQYDNFDISVWKVDDKAWMRERRAGWSSVKTTLDHMFEHNRNIFRDKKPYKYIKQFYLTGSIDFPEEIGGISYINAILGMNSPLDMWYAGGSIGGLLECWLTPEPSKEKWERVFERYEQLWIKRKEPKNIGRKFEESKICFQQASIQWFTDPDQVSLFNDLDAYLTDFFQPFSDISNYNFYWGSWTGLLHCFLKSCGWEGGYKQDGKPVYNSYHPVYKHSKEIIETFLPYYHNLEQSIIDGEAEELDNFIGGYKYEPELFKEVYNYEPETEKLSLKELFYKLKIYKPKKLQKQLDKRMAKLFSFLYCVANSQGIFHSEQVAFANKITIGIEQLDLSDSLRTALKKGKERSTNKKKIRKLMKYDG